MSLATRCPACSTVFRVVQDQLRVSEGWVRCGSCQEVFNALESLFELGAEAPPPTAPLPSGRSPTSMPAAAPDPGPVTEPTTELDLSDTREAASSAQGLASLPETTVEAPVQADLLGAIDATPLPAVDADEPAMAEEPAPEIGEPDDATIRQHDEAIDFAPPNSPTSETATPDADGHSTEAPLEPQREWQRKRPRRPREHAGAASDPLHEPAFLRRAARDARWQLPAVRAALGASAVLLGLLLLAQAALHFRDGLAARWPAVRPPLAGACATLGCQVGAPRALERISLDGSKLTSVESDAGGEKRLRFAAELHNAARHSVKAPALELSFTDALGQVVARRVLLPDELGLGSGSMAANSTWQVDTRLSVGELPVAGFSAEIFYP